jgi:hypothetical protein
MYELGIVEEASTGHKVRAAACYLITPEAMILMLQHLMHHNDLTGLVKQLTDEAAVAAAGGAASEPAAAAADNPFNRDEYHMGATVEILGDTDDVDDAGPAMQPVLSIARGVVKGLSTHTAAGTKVYEVGDVCVCVCVCVCPCALWHVAGRLQPRSAATQLVCTVSHCCASCCCYCTQHAACALYHTPWP